MKSILSVIFLFGIIHSSSSEYDDICGIENKPEGGRIIGGEKAGLNQFPWLVAVRLILDGRTGLCTGSIVNKNWILTAGHCVVDVPQFQIYVGSNDHSLPEEPHRQLFTTNESYHHPLYDSDSDVRTDDIALIKLQEDIEFNDYVRPTCLPKYSDAGNSYAGENVTATGWGRIKGNPNPVILPQLHYATDIGVIENSECKKVFGEVINERIICIDSSRGRGVCSGDSGGPLNYEMKNGKYLQIGVADFVYNLTCDDGLPEGFARVTEYLEWIEEMTGRTIED